MALAGEPVGGCRQEAAMEVIDLPVEQEKAYFQCLEEWSEEIREAGDHKQKWYERMRGQGLRVKVAVDEQGTVGGMIQYVPIEKVAVQGRDLYYVHCIWVHGYPQGRGDFRKRGMGKALLAAAEEDVRRLGAKGLVVWGLSLPFFMRASWFRRQGYRRVDRDGMQELLWKPFSADAAPPRWIKRKRKPAAEPGRVTVTCFKNGWCPGQNLVYERARRAAAELGEPVVFREIDTFDRNVASEWGISDALFVDGRQIRTGPPPSYEKIKQAIAGRLRKLKR
jgi:N-acetylglutamate synthase-like GNAT family acetyltransferase